MQVTQLDRTDNYALVGGNREGTFKINANAYTYKVLYDTLYSNKEMAVVRELMANCHDAMKMAGKPDEPFSVTLTKTEIIFEDTGPGIPHAKIQSIFCTLFGSTKTDDEDQIGGFGLGCKAPFALTDHFTVTSCHGGVKAVYAMHRGDETTGGIPGFREMVRVPCGDKTGLSVSVPLTEDQIETMNQLVTGFAKWSGMKVLYKNMWSKKPHLLEAFDLTAFEREGFAVFNERPRHLRNGQLFVSLGRVLYPVDEVERHSLTTLIPDGWCAVLKVQPGMVGVVPSREALSYTAQTKDYVQALIDHWAARLTSEIELEHYRVIERRYKGDVYRLADVGDGNWNNIPRGEFPRTGLHEAAKAIAEWHYVRSGARPVDAAKLVRRHVSGRHHKRGFAAKSFAKLHEFEIRNGRTILRRVEALVWLDRMNRLVRDIPGSILYARQPNGDYVRARRMDLDAHWLGHSDRDDVIVTDRVKMANEEVQIRRVDCRHSDTRLDLPAWAITVPKLTSDVQDRLRQVFARTDLNPFFIRYEKPEPVPKEEKAKVEKPKNLFVSVVSQQPIYNGRDHARIQPLSAPALADPAFYMDLPKRRSSGDNAKGICVPYQWYRYSRLLEELYPKTMIIDSAKDRAYCQKNNLPNVFTVIAEEFKAYAAKDNTYKAILRIGCDYTPPSGHVNGDIRDHLKKVAQNNIVSLFHIYGLPGEPTADHARCLKVALVANELMDFNAYQDLDEIRTFYNTVHRLRVGINNNEKVQAITRIHPSLGALDPLHKDQGVYDLFNDVLAFIRTRSEKGVSA